MNEESIKKAIEALGDNKDFPKHTDDPQANWLVDCITAEEFTPYDKELYEREVRSKPY